MPVSIVLDCISRFVLPKYRYIHLVFFDAFSVQKRRDLQNHFSYSKETKSKSSLLYRLVKFIFSQASDLLFKEVVNTFCIWCSIYNTILCLPVSGPRGCPSPSLSSPCRCPPSSQRANHQHSTHIYIFYPSKTLLECPIKSREGSPNLYLLIYDVPKGHKKYTE